MLFYFMEFKVLWSLCIWRRGWKSPIINHKSSIHKKSKYLGLAI